MCTIMDAGGHEQSATSWRWVIPALARTHRVLALSLPGHGDTAPAVGDYAPGSDLARFVAAFLDTLGVDRRWTWSDTPPAVRSRCGWPWPTPQRIRSLTLVDSAGLGREVHPLLALDTLPIIGELAIMISRLPGGDMGRTTMSAAMLFAQPWRVPAEFFTEQHALGRRPGQLEASTAMARALFGADRATPDPARPAPHPDHAHPGHLGRLRLRPARPPGPGRGRTCCPTGGWRCSPTAGTCPTSSNPTGSPPCSATGSPSTTISHRPQHSQHGQAQCPDRTRRERRRGRTHPAPEPGDDHDTDDHRGRRRPVDVHHRIRRRHHTEPEHPLHQQERRSTRRRPDRRGLRRRGRPGTGGQPTGSGPPDARHGPRRRGRPSRTGRKRPPGVLARQDRTEGGAA